MTKRDFILQSLLLQSATNLDPKRSVTRAEAFWDEYDRYHQLERQRDFQQFKEDRNR